MIKRLKTSDVNLTSVFKLGMVVRYVILQIGTVWRAKYYLVWDIIVDTPLRPPDYPDRVREKE